MKSGYLYAFNFYEGDEKTFSITLSEVNDNYYHTEPDIHLIVNEYYKNLKVSEK